MTLIKDTKKKNKDAYSATIFTFLFIRTGSLEYTDYTRLDWFGLVWFVFMAYQTLQVI